MSARWVIVADDLTGACDAGVAFAQRGWLTRVRLTDAATGEDVTVISTDSRDDDAQVAREKVLTVCRKFRGARFYKKIDSTLKGNISAEVEATLEGGGQAVIAPAYPALGRRYHRYALCGAASVPAVAVRDALERGQRIVVADASTETELKMIAEAALEFSPFPVLVGSGGLAAAVAAVYGRRPPAEARPPRKAASVAVYVGSTNPVTIGQVARLRAASHVLVHVPRHGEVRRIGNIEALVVCGGDTAAKVCSAWDVRAIRLAGEIVPGLPWGWIEGGAADGLPIATKAGGFGEKDALHRAVAFLSQQEDQGC